MKAIKVMAAIGFIWFSLGAYNLISISETWDPENRFNTVGTGVFMLVYGIALGVGILFQRERKDGTTDNEVLSILKQIDMLDKVKNEGMLNDDEYRDKKIALLSSYKNGMMK